MQAFSLAGAPGHGSVAADSAPERHFAPPPMTLSGSGDGTAMASPRLVRRTRAAALDDPHPGGETLTESASMETWETRHLLRVPPDLTPEIAARRCREVNLLLRSPLLLQGRPGDGKPLRAILEVARSIAPADRGLLYLWDEPAGKMELAAEFGFAHRVPGTLHSANPLASAAARRRKPVLVGRPDDLSVARQLRLLGRPSCLSVPILRSGAPWGVIQLLRQRPFQEEDGVLLWIFALILEGTVPALVDAVPSRREIPAASPSSLVSASRLQVRIDTEIERARWAGRPCGLILLAWRPAPGGTEREPATLQSPRILRALLRTLRPTDLVAPWGRGDLLVLMPEQDLEATESAARAIRRRLVQSGALGDREGAAQAALRITHVSCPAHGTRREPLLRAMGAFED
jgi:hypothetical protein